MLKSIIGALLSVAIVIPMSMPVSALAVARPVSAPAAATTPRDWDKLTGQDGELLPDTVEAGSAILMDGRTGKVLFEKNADTQRYPASITKIMTCYVALASKKDLSETVTIGKLPPLESGAETIDLKQGETITLEQLLYGLMLMSGNDAANAIAIAVAGSVDAFVALMNDTAKEIGMTNTHFMNTNGLNDPDHYTTARDMAILTRAAQQYPAFTELVSTVRYTMPPTNMHEKERTWTNHNLLIVPNSDNVYYYENATGVKTGYTSAAQHTLVSSAEKGSVRLITVVLHDGKYPKWTDSVTMFEYGFSFYESVDLKSLLSGRTVTVDIKNSAADDPDQGKLPLSFDPGDGSAFVTDRKSQIEALQRDPSQIRQTVELTKDTAPIRQGETVGTVKFAIGGVTILECDLKATRDIRAAAAPAAESKPGSPIVWLLLASALLLIAAFVAVRVINDRRRKRARTPYRYGRARARR